VTMVGKAERGFLTTPFKTLWRNGTFANTIRVVGFLAILIWALTTPGYLSALSFRSLLSSMAFVGLVAIGMTFITLSGNILSLALGVTASGAALVYCASLTLGPALAIIVTLMFGAAITALQGFFIGFLRANAILVSIAALGVITGLADMLTGGQRVYPAGPILPALKGRMLDIPVEILVFFICALVAQAFLSLTRRGAELVYVGSNRRAAEVSAVPATQAVTIAYALAGLVSALAGILLGSRYGSADMDLAAGFDYRAIAGVLVGGTAIAGGAGSVLKTAFGVFVIATVEMVLRLRGYPETIQYLATGLIVLTVVLLKPQGADT
jgi:ribose/xylose/arabinose/galactoside ABC-type transport system permease subunit